MGQMHAEKIVGNETAAKFFRLKENQALSAFISTTAVLDNCEPDFSTGQFFSFCCLAEFCGAVN